MLYVVTILQDKMYLRAFVQTEREEAVGPCALAQQRPIVLPIMDDTASRYYHLHGVLHDDV
jgi:hypothetical protein